MSTLLWAELTQRARAHCLRFDDLEAGQRCEPGPSDPRICFLPTFHSHMVAGRWSLPLSVLCDGHAVLVGEPWAGDQETGELVLALYCLAV